MDQSALDAVELTKQLIRIQSESRQSNVAVTDAVHTLLAGLGYSNRAAGIHGPCGVEKACLVAKAGPGAGGLGIFAHSDTVPGMPGAWEPFEPHVDGAKLVGRGACDMKGPLAAAILAAAQIPLGRASIPALLRHSPPTRKCTTWAPIRSLQVANAGGRLARLWARDRANRFASCARAQGRRPHSRGRRGRRCAYQHRDGRVRQLPDCAVSGGDGANSQNFLPVTNVFAMRNSTRRPTASTWC